MIGIERIHRLMGDFNWGYAWTKDSDRETVRIRMFRGDIPIGRVSIQRMLGDEDWEMTGINCTERGSGKLLYYFTMDNIYPSYLRPDSAGSTKKSARVWESLLKVPYVESEVLGATEYDDGDVYLEQRHRFKLPWKI